jgi:tetratricopeptide (TPR) repeat protein
MVTSHDTEQGAQSHWLEWAEGATIAGAVGGIVLSAVTQQLLFISVPLTLAAALNFGNRQRMKSEIQTHVLPTMNLHAHQIERQDQDFKALSGTSAATDQIVMIQLNKFQNESQGKLEKLQSDVEILQQSAAEMIQKQTELLESTAEEGYCRRGQEAEKRGNLKDAVAAYSEAIRLKPEYARAYIYRGCAYACSGFKQQSIADLRTATKICFENGDLETYHEARALSEKIHAGQLFRDADFELVREITHHSESSVADKIAVDELFV